MNGEILCSLIFGIVIVHAGFDLNDLKDQVSTLTQYFTYDPNDLGLDPYLETKQYGYPAENHNVITQDGYTLTLLRIPYGKSGAISHQKRPVVLLVPGFLLTAASYTDNIATSNHSLAYSLVDSGYDVWILNPRGTTFSRKHMIYNPLTDEEYWNFGWHEIGVLDIPTTIDYILPLTNEKQLNVIGFSQGTTTSMLMLSEKPAYNEKVKVLFALAPVVFQEYANKDNAMSTGFMVKAISAFIRRNNFVILPHNRAMSEPIMQTCHYESNSQNLTICQGFVENLVGHPQANIDPRALYHIMSHFPGGASIQQVEHYNQLQLSGGFKKFDYGAFKNQQIYGQISPPSYKLENVKIPVYLVYGDSDRVAVPLDILNLHKHLSNSSIIRVDDMLWSHLDFVFAKEAYKLVYKDIIKILNTYNQCR